jgi:hypothetical protein
MGTSLSLFNITLVIPSLQLLAGRVQESDSLGECVALRPVTKTQLLARFWQRLRCDYYLSIIRPGGATRSSVVPAYTPPSGVYGALSLGLSSYTSTQNDGQLRHQGQG